MVPIIKPHELLSIKDKEGLVIIDARASADAKEKYQAQHLDKAVYVDMENDLAQKTSNPADGGRHPLPPEKKFAELLGQLGIGPETHVIVYDDKNGANAAARFWWMLTAAGHQKVQVVDGGFDAAKAAGFPLISGEEKPSGRQPYEFNTWQLPVVTIDEVEELVNDPGFMVVDVRDAERYRGDKEPIDLVAGHIPGAVNIPFAGNLDSDGSFLSPEALHEKYTKAIGQRDPGNIIVHCGSGVTACHTLLAMSYAGIPGSKLYVGSWSEWSRTGRGIGKGE